MSPITVTLLLALAAVDHLAGSGRPRNRSYRANDVGGAGAGFDSACGNWVADRVKRS